MLSARGVHPALVAFLCPKHRGLVQDSSHCRPSSRAIPMIWRPMSKTQNGGPFLDNKISRTVFGPFSLGLYCKLGAPNFLGPLFSHPCGPCLEMGLLHQLTPNGEAIWPDWWLLGRKRMQKDHRWAFDSLVMLVCWLIWKERNALGFRQLVSMHLSWFWVPPSVVFILVALSVLLAGRSWLCILV
jgi:hypothetical protein